MVATQTGTNKPNGHAPPYSTHQHSPEVVAWLHGRGKEQRNGHTAPLIADEQAERALLGYKTIAARERAMMTPSQPSR